MLNQLKLAVHSLYTHIHTKPAWKLAIRSADAAIPEAAIAVFPYRDGAVRVDICPR